MKKYLTIFSIILSITLVVGIPATLYYLYPETPSDIWIDFSGAYIGSIVGVIIAAVLALVTSHIEGKKQRKEFQEQLQEQKKTDIEVQNTYLKNKLIIEKKSEVVYESMLLMQGLPNLHNFVFNSLDDNQTVDKNEFDAIEKELLKSTANIGKNKAYIADRIKLYQDMLANVYEYISTIKKYIPAEMTRQIELSKGNELVEIDRKMLEDFGDKLRLEANKLKSREKRTANVMTNLVDNYLISEEQVESHYNEATKCMEKFYKEIDRDVYKMLNDFN